MARTHGLVWTATAIGLSITLAPATSHEWYPRECCGNVDCAPVEHVEELADGYQRFTTRVGTTIVPPHFPSRLSPDDRMHVCMVRFSHSDIFRPVCVFLPLTNM
jgi:hypothetical protein